jgi:hypothetical protein
MLFEPGPDDAAGTRSSSKRYGRVNGFFWLLGTAGTIVALIYLFGFLD